MRFTAVDVVPPLVSRNDIAKILDRTRAQQGLPMRFAGQAGECRRQHTYFHPDISHRPEKLRETEIVADRHPQFAKRCIDHDDLVARFNRF